MGQDCEIMMDDIINAELSLPEHLSPEATSILEQLLEKDPQERLGASRTSDVRLHPFFDGVSFDALMQREVSVSDWVPADFQEMCRDATLAKLQEATTHGCA